MEDVVSPPRLKVWEGFRVNTVVSHTGVHDEAGGLAGPHDGNGERISPMVDREVRENPRRWLRGWLNRSRKQGRSEKDYADEYEINRTPNFAV
jgi:hypothetical protein